MSAADNALELRDVAFVRGGRTLLEDISLTVRRGEHWALIGPNGAGKTTLLNLFGALSFPTRGEVHVLGHKLGRVDLRELRRSIGHVNPRHQIGSNLSVEEVVLTGETGTNEMVPRWQPSPETRDRARLLIKTLGTDTDEPHGHTMSQGERGRALTSDLVTETFDHPIEVGRRRGRWFAMTH
ncbi:ATP-binding cassette domain-containing protein [Nocardioides sp. JQ2195]|uniref:ATP-binding cassette domain-containing protein n=1 Tax=Nocardioides sp. JQ2195 TaxID=2592334 RepID=UPI00197F745F|nr:ATP-binding cassette domain-containing protein [Nocardioides sp. JQ2195]